MMRISLSGVLIRAAETCGRSRDAKHLDFMLRQLRHHINILRDHPEKLPDFLDLYIDEEPGAADR